MKQSTIERRFEEFLRQHALKLTAQRKRIFDRTFATHEHFSAEKLYGWLREEEGARVSRATVYRTLDLLVKGGFLGALDTGQSELVYEHVLGHDHHDHMICIACGRIEEFHDERIEELQRVAAEKHGFTIERHLHRLMGYCRACSRSRERRASGDVARVPATEPRE